MITVFESTMSVDMRFKTQRSETGNYVFRSCSFFFQQHNKTILSAKQIGFQRSKRYAPRRRWSKNISCSWNPVPGSFFHPFHSRPWLYNIYFEVGSPDQSLGVLFFRFGQVSDKSLLLSADRTSDDFPQCRTQLIWYKHDIIIIGRNRRTRVTR